MQERGEHFHLYSYFLCCGCRRGLECFLYQSHQQISLYHTESSPTICVPCVLEMLPRLKEPEIDQGKWLIGICRRSQQLLFINTPTLVVTLPSPGHEKPATVCRWHIDWGFWWKERASCNFHFYYYTYADSSTDSNLRWMRGSALCWAEKSNYHQNLKGFKWEDKWEWLPFQKPAVAASICLVKHKKV